MTGNSEKGQGPQRAVAPMMMMMMLMNLKKTMEEMKTLNQPKTGGKLNELTETNEITQMVLQMVEVSFDTKARKLQENLEVIKADLTTNLTMVSIEVKTTRKEALTQQRNLEETTDANERDFQARLDVVEARTGRRRTRTVGVSPVQPPTFNENRSWSVFQ
jgi:hypothetical protein